MKKKKSLFLLFSMPPTSLTLSWAYCWGRNGYGREWRCSWENREERVWHVSTAMCCFPAYSHQTLLLSLPHFRTDHCSKEPKTMKQENTHPILKFWMGPFSLYFLFPHLISDHVMLPQKTVFFKFRPIHVYMHVQFQKRQKANSLENIT